MSKEELLELSVENVRKLLNNGELISIAKTLGAFWTYDYKALEDGRPGLHALLKSGLHSDGFFVSKILLEPTNIRVAIAELMADKLIKSGQFGNYVPNYVVGIPDGATALGSIIATAFNAQLVKMEKSEGKIKVVSYIPPHANLLLVEDFCTRGTGFQEAVLAVLNQQPEVKFVMCNPVIINRGGLSSIFVNQVFDKGGSFQVLPLVENRIQDWSASECPLCQKWSGVIKPKATDHNWRLITGSQSV